MVVLPVLFLLGSLFHCGHARHYPTMSALLSVPSAEWLGPLICDPWDCDCAYDQQRGCCCAARDMFKLEDETFLKIKYLWHDISALSYRVHEHIDSTQVAFKAAMDPNIAKVIPGSSQRCFGPFNANVPIPYSSVTLNHYNGFNPSLGVFTAPVHGVYFFSFTVFSYVETNGRLYHKVQLMKNGGAVTSVWEDNREDHEDNANQNVILELYRGDQVYTELMSGRKLCNYMQFNIFTGYILYPYPYPYHDYYDY